MITELGDCRGSTVRLHQCGVINPRFGTQFSDLEKRQNNPLSSHQFGFIVLMTSAGITDQEKATLKHTGQKILLCGGVTHPDKHNALMNNNKKDYYFFTAMYMPGNKS